MNQNLNPISLEGTVVGILFTKTGEEIQEAVASKIADINEEVTEYQEAIKDVDAFLEKKEDQIQDLDNVYQERRDEKEASARPFRRQVEEIHKTWEDKEFDFNKETENLVGVVAVKLEKGFDKFEERFSELDDLLDDINSTSQVMMMQASMGAPGASADGFTITDTMDSSRSLTRMKTAKALLPTKQDKALARINTLRNQVTSYRSKVVSIQGRINVLEDEMNELELVKRHISPTREYTLDLSRLSSLGFEV